MHARGREKVDHSSKLAAAPAAKRALFARLALPLALLLAAPAWALDEAGLARELIEAKRSGAAMPVLSRREALSLEQAYALQRRLVEAQLAGGQRIAGYKAGLTAAGSQQKFGLQQPVVGVLLASGRQPAGAPVRAADYRQLRLETEIGFVFGRAVHAPLDLDGLRRAVRGFVPAVELPELGFAEAKFNGVDLVAGNVAARGFVFGREVPAAQLDPNAVRVQLWRDGAQIGQGSARDALGDQWQAALWLVNELLARGHAIEPGQVLITGVLGPLYPGAPGRYRAEYEGLGRLEFSVE